MVAPKCLLVACVLAASAACGGGPGPERRTTGSGEGQGPQALRFAIEVAQATAGPLYVGVDDADAQPGWISLYRDGERVYIRERCEIADCGLPPAVCGAVLPTVLDVTRAPDRTIDLEWDRRTSVVDTFSGCESRGGAPSDGAWVARFCFSREVDAGTVGAQATAGRLVDRECRELSFDLDDREVVLPL